MSRLNLFFQGFILQLGEALLYGNIPRDFFLCSETAQTLDPHRRIFIYRLLGVGRILGRRDSNGEASTSDRGAEDCSPTDSGSASLTESKVSVPPFHRSIVSALYRIVVVIHFTWSAWLS